ncbi:sodium ion-translocating decarboxylase subunit beta [Oscillibacter sp. MSJ-2]|uniref:Sodium ion-translocating decarboxylase subunit beta n=1 Tax=Dysosmobacter acutus TaxID=2841504 RepID=A0ABS6FA32_9FIRM|nr:sodium ion-translocating decarboxylase subunit beta [Dysosmobacter acutus]
MTCLLAGVCLFGLFGCSSESIGIIGGADGPTVIFVSGQSNWVYFVLAGILIVGIIVFLLFKRKR